ncbi:hypothetical protein Q0F99_19100 [Rathayibacter oskolensis]|uniref:hypothetical protein n=1 Tax=Rathayibacter oskolensis TaxID=1891671 RepID=UPI00265FD3C3|nr:hypothetical protein [Rathayibacter oskolensis]WKK71448.1 hypothetical protein Q0F99_19100 [Rathayibacter oskolensis]
MKLNIVAHRKVSLKGFAEGWDDCYLRVRALSEPKRAEWSAKVDARVDDAEYGQILRQACIDAVVGGVIMNTDEAGVASSYEFSTGEVADVVDALSIAWQGEVMEIATGSDRLKATTSSL